MKKLSNGVDRHTIARRIGELTPSDTRRWGLMNVHQMVCHLDDSYKIALGQKTSSPAGGGRMQGSVIKWFALKAPMRWPKGVPTRPEVEQGKGGTLPGDFNDDLASLQGSLSRFCEALPRPLPTHPIFGAMTMDDWMRWGYLHADHHLRQFGR